MRDWGENGHEARHRMYFDGIIPGVLLRLPIDSMGSTRPKILIPGAGLGRLAVELLANGYDVGKRLDYIQSQLCA